MQYIVTVSSYSVLMCIFSVYLNAIDTFRLIICLFTVVSVSALMLLVS